jgi:putative endonuclease
MGLWLYIIECSDHSFYTGVTNNLERRIFEHNEGIIPDCYTHNRRPVKLVYSEEFSNHLDAINREKQVKGWGRAKKKALIRNDFKKLKELSKAHHG